MAPEQLTAEQLHPETINESPTESPLARYSADLHLLCVKMILHYMNTKQMPSFNLGEYPEPLRQNGASFVTLNRVGRLRGCIGTIDAHRPLCADIAANAIGSGFFDTRFTPLTPDDLNGLTISISVLTPKTERNFAGEEELLDLIRPQIDGLVIADGNMRAVYLPSVWEQIPDKRQFLTQLKLKAGMTADHWSPNFKAWTYQADKTTPTPFPPINRGR